MVGNTSLELLTFNLKLLGKQTRKRILISAGKDEDKERMLVAVRRLQALSIDIFATPGTHRLFVAKGISCTEIHKIADSQAPNILTFLKADRFDLVVNVLTGDKDYDESSDAKLIRQLAVENGIPLITDADVAIATLEKVVTDVEKGTYRYKLADDSEPWNLHLRFLEMVAKRGGFATHHGHMDRAYLITMDTLKLGQIDMQKKWDIYKSIKENYTHAEVEERISRALDIMIDQGVTYCRSFVDADSTVKMLAIEAALTVKEKYKDKIHFDITVHTLQGVLDAENRRYYEEACKLADYCGGLPSRDRPHPEEHLDIVLSTAKKLGKPVEIHIDQENNPLETETELLADKIIEHGMEGQVYGVHAISLSAKDESEQDRIIAKVKKADMGIVICPSAAISMKQLPMTAPLHNSIAPFPKLVEAGVRCYLGIDNIQDFFMPFVDGDIWTECRVLMEACRFYDIEKVADWACAKPIGFGK